MTTQISNTILYTGAASIVGVGLIGLGKVGLFLKNNGSIVSTALLSGVATAAIVPLSKKGLEFIPPDIMDSD